MRDILARAQRQVLDQLAGSEALLAFDFDGTLAPIVSDPRRAAMRPSTRSLLRAVARAYPCVVISGRARSDVRRRLLGVDLAAVVGNHGLEPWRASAGARRKVLAWMPLLEESLGGIQGVAIEDKRFSIAVHYRQSRQKKKARARVLAAALRLGEVRLVGGKQVLNILPEGAPHKGLALERARAHLGCDTALYIGDDETDEDVFALDQPGQLLAIRVGRRSGSAAAYYVRSQTEVDGLLKRLIALRTAAAGERGRRADA